MIRNILLVGLGGGIGRVLRYIIQRWVNISWPNLFPWATFSVNITGCFLIGVFWGMSFRSFDSNENWKLLLMTGLCGGFTTFSAFTLESIGLLKEDRTGIFFSYILASVALCLLFTYAGIKLVR